MSMEDAACAHVCVVCFVVDMEHWWAERYSSASTAVLALVQCPLLAYCPIW